MARTTDPAERERRRATMEEHRITSAIKDTVGPSLTAGDGDVRAAQAFLLWARHHRIAISDVQIGACRVVVMDLGLPTEPPSRDDRRAQRDADRMYERYGGDVLRRFEAEAEAGATYEDDDEDETEDAPPRASTRKRSKR